MSRNGMIVYKKGLIYKIKEFFKNIFKRKINNQTIIVEEIDNTSLNEKNDFKENIVIKKDKEEIELLKLQESFKNGDILEEDIPEEFYEKVIELYKKQNQQMREKIEKEKVELKKILKDLKVS